MIVWSLGGGIFTWAVEHVPPYLAFHIGLSQFHVVPIVSLASYGGLHLVNAFIVFVNLCFYFASFLLSLYGYEDPIKNKNGIFSSKSLEPILKFFEGQGFKPILKKQVSVEDLKNWPLPSLLFLKINNGLRPVTLINFFSSQGAYVFDPQHPNGFVSVSSSELSQYFAGEGVQLFPPR